jgi:hypothetical protein
MVRSYELEGVRRLSFEDTRTMDVYSKEDVEAIAMIGLPNPAYDLSAPQEGITALLEVEIFVKGVYVELSLEGQRVDHLVYVQGEPFVPGVQTTKLEDIVSYRSIEGGPLIPKIEGAIPDSYPADI